MPIRNAAGREVDSVAAHEPVLVGIELDIRRESRKPVVCGVAERPYERGPVDAGIAGVGDIGGEVVDDTVAVSIVDPSRPLVQGEDQ
jgi:hypothetical protein